MVILQIQKIQMAVLGMSAGSTGNWLYALIKSNFEKKWFLQYNDGDVVNMRNWVPIGSSDSIKRTVIT